MNVAQFWVSDMMKKYPTIRYLCWQLELKKNHANRVEVGDHFCSDRVHNRLIFLLLFLTVPENRNMRQGKLWDRKAVRYEERSPEMCLRAKLQSNRSSL